MVHLFYVYTIPFFIKNFKKNHILNVLRQIQAQKDYIEMTCVRVHWQVS